MPFEFDGEAYKKASTHQKEWGEKLISQLNLKGSERILDLGCGDGGITAKLAELVPNGLVIGIDASHGMIESSQKAHKAKNLRFDLMDINDINFGDEFDVVFSNATLHWVKDHRRLLANVYKSLKADGTARFNFAGDGNCSTFFKVIGQVMAKREYAGYFSDFDWPWYMPSIDEYERLLRRSSFEETRIWGENADRFFPDAEAVTKWIDQPNMVPFLKRIDEADKRSFRETVVERMIEETIQDDGRCFETFRRINVFAKK